MNNTDILLTPLTHKRRANSFLSSDEYEIIIKKKHSHHSHHSTADTADSLSRSDFVCSPIASKILLPDLTQTPEQTLKLAKDKLSALKVCQSSKKHKSAHLNSYEEIKKNYMSDPQDYVDTFKVVKFKNIKYKLNTCMLVKNESDAENDFVCKLLRIIRPNKVDNKKILAFLEVQWYYRKNDLPKKYAYLLPHISSNEVFLSPHKDFIMIDCINGPCEILTLEAYDQLTSTSNNIFYTRAQYDTISKKLDPPAEQWKKHCVCKTPMNPDLLYIQCDKCNGWYHTECIHLSLEEAEAAEEFVCMMCTGDPNVVLPKEFEFKNHYQHHRKRKNSHLHQKNNKKGSTRTTTVTTPPASIDKEEDMKISENTMNTVSTLASSSENKDLESDSNSRQSNPLFPNEVEFRDDMRMSEALKSLDELFQTLDHSSGFKTSSRPIELSVINMENEEKNSVRMEIDFSAEEESEEEQAEEEALKNRMRMMEEDNKNPDLGLEPNFNNNKDLEEEECREFFDNFDDHFGEAFPPQDLDKITRTRHEQETFIM